jgi:hypothetical protein
MSDQRFCIIPSRALEAETLKGIDIKVLCYFGKHADKHGWWRLSQVKMAKYFNCARSTVQNSVNRLIEAELLEKHPIETESGRDSAHYWRVVFDHGAPEQGTPNEVAKSRALAGEKSAQNGDEIGENDPCRQGGTPADISAPPADPESAPPADPESAPSITTHLNDPPLTERKGAPARGDVLDKEKKKTVSDAEMQKRLQRFVKGDGFKAGEWMGWAGSSINYILKQFGDLSEDERLAAERWRDAYLRDCVRQKTKPAPVGNYFKSRQWEYLSDEVMKRSNKQDGVHAAKGVVADDGKSKPYSIAWMVWRMEHLMRGPEQHLPNVHCGSSPIRSVKSKVWPRLTGFDDTVGLNMSLTLHERYKTFNEAMVWVDAGDPLWAEWLAVFERNDWPHVPNVHDLKGAYFPKGGPDGLQAFSVLLGVDWEPAGDEQASEVNGL